VVGTAPLYIEKGIAAKRTRRSQKDFLKMVVKMDGEGARRLSIAYIPDAVGIKLAGRLECLPCMPVRE
jgi:hypothetical protein